MTDFPLRPPSKPVGDLSTDAETPTPVEGATWYVARSPGDGLGYRFPPGTLAGAQYLTFDALLDDLDLAVFELTLAEGADGPRFELTYGLLNRCGARIRLPTDAVTQNRWTLGREGAWLKPRVEGDRVRLDAVDRLTVRVRRKHEGPVRWCQTPVTAVAEAPEPLSDPALPAGPLLDELGQSALREWPGKSKSAEEVTARLRSQRERAASREWPDGFGRWGGRVGGSDFESTGFFRTRRDGDRWWLVDPDGRPFFSSGVNCVGWALNAYYQRLEDALAWLPDADGTFDAVRNEAAVDYLGANLIRAFGPDEWESRWAEILVGELRRLGFNTVGNWSDWDIAREGGFPYVRPLDSDFPQTPFVFRDFPDPFDAGLRRDAAEFARPLRSTVDDPAMVGYFLGNEPTWSFAAQTPAAGMLYATESCAARDELAGVLEARYGDSLADAWGLPVDVDDVRTGRWTRPLSDAARTDLRAFSERMVDRLYRLISDACREVDPNHLNLGTRFPTTPPRWARTGMRHVDVVSVNCYKNRVPMDELSALSEDCEAPVLIGEWHFGALDAGPPGGGIRRVSDQTARGEAFRTYLEAAAAAPWCVGAHYFALYDQSALGRFDGENANIGFLDVCNRPYEPLARAARRSHERLYALTDGDATPYDGDPAYLPGLFV